MQTQQARRLQVVPAQVIALALGLFLVLILAATFGFWLKGLSVSHNSSPTFSVGVVGAQQIAHSRSESGLDVVSVGGQQIAHNRSEEGLTDR